MPRTEIEGQLAYGVERDGRRHVAFRLGSLSVAQFLELELERAKLADQPAGPEREVALVRHGMRRLHARLRQLGELNLATWTPEGLMTELRWPDMLTLSAAADELDTELDSFRAGRGWAPAHADGAQPANGLDAR